jgi:hypothetical protein
MGDGQTQRWEYEFVEIGANPEVDFEELQRHGDAGWDAVGIAMRGQQTVVLLKRPRAPRQP